MRVRLPFPTATLVAPGLKDRHAITRQWLSIPAAAEPRLSGLELEGMRILQHSRHNNKLRTGHNKGNRFTVVLNEVSDTERPALLGQVFDLGRGGSAQSLWCRSVLASSKTMPRWALRSSRGSARNEMAANGDSCCRPCNQPYSTRFCSRRSTGRHRAPGA